jgi:hypothetical protein
MRPIVGEQRIVPTREEHTPPSANFKLQTCAEELKFNSARPSECVKFNSTCTLEPVSMSNQFGLATRHGPYMPYSAMTVLNVYYYPRALTHFSLAACAPARAPQEELIATIPQRALATGVRAKEAHTGAPGRRLNKTSRVRGISEREEVRTAIWDTVILTHATHIARQLSQTERTRARTRLDTRALTITIARRHEQRAATAARRCAPLRAAERR